MVWSSRYQALHDFDDLNVCLSIEEICVALIHILIHVWIGWVHVCLFTLLLKRANQNQVHESQELSKDISDVEVRRYFLLIVVSCFLKWHVLVLNRWEFKQILKQGEQGTLQRWLSLLLPDNVEQGWLLSLHQWEDFILELLLNLVVPRVFQELVKLTLMSHHEGGEQNVPIAEDYLTVVLYKVSES